MISPNPSLQMEMNALKRSHKQASSFLCLMKWIQAVDRTLKKKKKKDTRKKNTIQNKEPPPRPKANHRRCGQCDNFKSCKVTHAVALKR